MLGRNVPRFASLSGPLQRFWPCLVPGFLLPRYATYESMAIV